MTAPELLRAAGWRQGHNADGSEYWEHDKFRLMRHSLDCALGQELDWEQDELAHARPMIKALHEGQDELRRQLAEARKEALEVQRAAEQGLAAERRTQAKELSRLARYDAVARKVRDNGLTFCGSADRKVLRELSAIPTQLLRDTLASNSTSSRASHPLAKAELERRGELP
jgi:hypothetical protein